MILSSLKKRGFSLIELMVVITIITIITSIVITNLTKARSLERDRQRISDISELQLSLANFLNKNGSYPQGATDALIQLVNENLVPFIPLDPTNDGTHKYGYSSTGTSYCMTAILESANTYQDPEVTASNCVTEYSNPANIPSNQVYRVRK
jgi:prepilin-type N-terminal cleavage/methylation domain-containing protein